MKKAVLFVLSLAFVFSLSVSIASAGGDNNCYRHQGEMGQGSVIQNQERINQS